MTYLITNESGETYKRTLRNCDRCADLADAKAKFRKENGADGCQFWRRLAEWLLEDAK